MRTLTFMFVGGRLHVHDVGHVPASGPVIVVSNHIATVDPPLVASRIPRKDVFSMAKAEAFSRPVARFFLTGWNAFPVVRHTADRAALSHALTCLAEGHILIMFPEGTRSADTALHRAYPGVGFLALRSGAPVVCAAIAGTEDVMPKGRYWPHRAEVELRFGEPFRVPRRHPDGRRVSNQEAADQIMSGIAHLLPARYRGAYPAAVTDLPAAREPQPSGDTDGDGAKPTTPRVPAA